MPTSCAWVAENSGTKCGTGSRIALPVLDCRSLPAAGLQVNNINMLADPSWMVDPLQLYGTGHAARRPGTPLTACAISPRPA